MSDWMRVLGDLCNEMVQGKQQEETGQDREEQTRCRQNENRGHVGPFIVFKRSSVPAMQRKANAQ